VAGQCGGSSLKCGVLLSQDLDGTPSKGVEPRAVQLGNRGDPLVEAETGDIDFCVL
jgi:hypothetical protein